MPGITEWVFLLLAVTQFMLGMLGNGFIGLAHGSNWLRGRRISLSDSIITLLALCSIILLWVFLLDISLTMFPFKVHNEVRLSQILGLLWTFIHHLTLWLLACLSVLYCLKVSSFSHPVFLWLKWRVSRVVAWMLLGALLMACASTVSRTQEFKFSSVLFGITGEGNTTENVSKESQYRLTHVLGTLWDLPPPVMTLVSYCLLLLSLRRHTGQMQQYGTRPSDPSTEAHERAIKIIFSFLSLFLLFLFAILLTSFRYFLPESEMIKMMGVAIVMFHSVAHSFILIFGNNKLKKMFVQMLKCQPRSEGPFPL